MKKCKICNIEKSNTDFYKHPYTKDKLSYKCISCAKDVSKKKYNTLKSDPDFILKSRIRAREKYHKYKYKSKKSFDTDLKYKQKYPEKIQAQIASQYIKIEKGYHKHHWSYNENHYKDIIVLDVSTHHKLHRFLVYDQNFKKYRKIDNNELIDTKDKHIEYINYIKKLP